MEIRNNPFRSGAVLAACVAALAISSSGLAQPAAVQDRPHIITHPDWVTQPTQNQFDSIFPARVLRLGRSGTALMTCTVTDEGLVQNCQVARESPSEGGYGDAAVAAAQFFRMKPMTIDGVPVGGARVDIPMYFTVRGDVHKPDPTDRLYSNIDWVAAPTAAQWAAAYPARLKAKPLSGAALLRCKFGDGGVLTNCEVRAENPQDKGFGAAALTLMRYFRGPTKSAGEDAMGGQVNVTVDFPQGLASQDPATVVAEPKPVVLPSHDDFEDAFPVDARAKGITSGRAILACARNAAGAAADCVVESESPAGAGFGAAALSMVPNLKYTVWASFGRPTSDKVRIPILFGPQTAGG